MNVDRPDPPYAAIPALWASLPAEVQAELGCMLVEYEFADFVGGEDYADHNQLCTTDIQVAALRRRDDMMGRMEDRVGELFPELFGTPPSDEHPDGMDPPWAWFDPEEMATAITAAERAVEATNEKAEQAVADLAQAHRRVADLERVAAARRARA